MTNAVPNTHTFRRYAYASAEAIDAVGMWLGQYFPRQFEKNTHTYNNRKGSIITVSCFNDYVYCSRFITTSFNSREWAITHIEWGDPQLFAKLYNHIKWGSRKH